MNGVSDSSSKISKQLFEIEPSKRGRILLAAVSFAEYVALSDCLPVGPLRSVVADWWLDNFQELISVSFLRNKLQPPIPIGLAQQFANLERCEDENELLQTVKTLACQLRENVNQPTRQLPLFPTETATRPRRFPSKLKLESPHSGACVSDLSKLVRNGAKFSTIYADPPWPYKNTASRAAAENHYPTLSLDEIKAEPVSILAADNAHLHLWTTNAFLRESFEVMEAWGFEFKSCLLWIKPNIGMGNYWRVSHEFLCLGVRGKLTFSDRTLPSWLLADRTIHSRKPRKVRDLIERVSQPPFLELYGREPFPNSAWTVYGNQIEQLLF